MGYATTKVITSASEKYHVIMACRTIEKGEKAKAEIEASGIKGQISLIRLDHTDQSLIDKAVEYVKTKFGRLDALVNNAAVGNLDDNVQTRFQASLENNVTGPAMLAASFRPLLLKSSNPYSIWVSSGLGSFGLNMPDDPRLPNADAYRATKSALNMLALLEYSHFKDQGLKTFAVCPGFVVSNLRGTDEDLRSGWGQAGDPMVSGETILNIVAGNRDADVGKFVHKDGLYPW